MGVKFTKLGPDNKRHIYPVPEGESPDSVATEKGLAKCIWDYCENEAEATRRMDSDPTGKLDWHEL